jgi:hypothetical protein
MNHYMKEIINQETLPGCLTVIGKYKCFNGKKERASNMQCVCS